MCLVTEKRRMCRHVGAFQHLSKATKSANDAFHDLEGCSSALIPGLSKAHVVGVVRITWHARKPSTISASVHVVAIHAISIAITTTSVHATHAATHAAIHATHATHATPTEAGVGR